MTQQVLGGTSTDEPASRQRSRNANLRLADDIRVRVRLPGRQPSAAAYIESRTGQDVRKELVKERKQV